MFGNSIDFTIFLFSSVFLNLNRGLLGNNLISRCHSPKPYSFCGAFTNIETQWYFDRTKHKCLPYEYCIIPGQKQLNKRLRENRFKTESDCEYFCTRRLYLDPIKQKQNEEIPQKEFEQEEIKQEETNDDETNRLEFNQNEFKHQESDDLSRCSKPKAYSFCGAATRPKVHWYYSKTTDCCFPYTYCESLEMSKNHENHDNSFYSDKFCTDLCVKNITNQQNNSIATTEMMQNS